MSLTIEKRCAVCKTLKTDKRLLKRIYESKAYVAGGEPLTVIAAEYKGQFSYESLWNHCDKHQGVSPDDLKKKRMQRKVRELESAQIREAIHHKSARQELIEVGVKGIRSGDIKMTAAAAVSLLKQQSDIEEKDKDRQLEVIKMVQQFQSGEMSYDDSENPWGDPEKNVWVRPVEEGQTLDSD